MKLGNANAWDGQVTLKHMMEGGDHGWTLRYDNGTGRTVPLSEKNNVRGDFVLVLPPSTSPYQRTD